MHRFPFLRRSRLAPVLVLAACLLAVLSPAAGAAPVTRTVAYRGYQLRVPSSWPVYNLNTHPGTCVRFNRHAVYVGRPGANQACPSQSVGRTEAVLIEPSGPQATAAGPTGTDVATRVITTRHVTVVASWNHHAALIQRLLGFHSLSALAASAPRPRPRAASAAGAPRVAHAALSAFAASAGSPSTAGAVYTGKGFDVCSTPSSSQMSAWGSSPYRAIGVYIGGVNRACSQPNLTTSWVQQESAYGWHLIPIYVGLQAPSNSCGCAGISPSRAGSQGTAAADDAVAQAQAVGLGPGNPLYFDMEGYNRTSTNSSAVLKFLAAWTARLHADGYRSAVYSSELSGISDLVSQWGTTYTEPDEIWPANWNGQANTADSYIPSNEWANHQRLHQYSGGVNQTYGGVTLNIDQDYVDAPTASGCGAAGGTGVPINTCPPRITGYAYAGQTLTEHHGSWSGGVTTYSYQWYRCQASDTAACGPIPGATARTYVLQGADVGYAIRVAETGGNLYGAGTPGVSMPTATVQPAPSSSYWLTTSYGNVYNGVGAPFYGSAARAHDTSIVGIAATPSRHGYWLADATGRVFHYGNAGTAAAVRPAHPVIGIVSSPHGGYYVFTGHGNVYGRDGAAFYGSAAHRHVTTIVGMAVTPDGRGYWLVKAGGRALAYGDAVASPVVHSAYPIAGIVASRTGGYWLYTAHGNVYNVGGAPFFGSPSRSHVSNVTGMIATPDGQGYRTVQSSGQVRAYGDAEALPGIRPAHPVIGIAG